MSRIRADQLVNRVGSGGPKFPHGVAEGFSVSGIVTATSYRGDGSQLTGIDASSLKDGSNVKVQAVSSGANVTGNVAATGNVTAVDVTASGNVSAVNATFSGDLTVNGTTTTIDTAVTAVDSLAVDGSVGIGTTNPTAKLSVFTDGVEDSFRIGTPDGSDTLIRLGSTGTDADTHAVIKYDKDDNYLSLIVSGESHGAGGVLIANGGNVGMGNLNPTAGKLVITSSSNGGFGGSIVLENSNNSDTDKVAIAFRPNGSSTSTIGNRGESRIIGEYDSGNSVGANHLQFWTHAGNGTVTERLRITSDGHVLPGEDNLKDLGSSSKRWRNIYTGDLNLSNEGSANDVDGTWGQYTIQEGEDDLFLINRRTGKKYKFNLTEVN